MQSFIEIELVIWTKSVGRGPILSPTPTTNNRLKTLGQIELNMNFPYIKISTNYFHFPRKWFPSFRYMY